jgi:hypothetical protein
MSPLRRSVLVIALVLLYGAAAVVWLRRLGPAGEDWGTWRMIGALTTSWHDVAVGVGGQLALVALVALTVGAGGLVLSEAPPPWMRVLAIIAAATVVVGGAIVFVGGADGTAVTRAIVPPLVFQLAGIAALVASIPRLRS